MLGLATDYYAYFGRVMQMQAMLGGSCAPHRLQHVLFGWTLFKLPGKTEGGCV